MPSLLAAMDDMHIIESALRGGAAGLNILLAGLLLFSRPPGTPRILGALFAAATSAYVLVSADHFEVLGVFEHAAEFVAVFNIVFFWWFALSLFEDEFVWDRVKLAPLALTALFHAPLPVWRAPVGDVVEQALNAALSVLLLAHAIWIALRDRSGDLVGPRRRFRIVFALMVGAAGIAIVIGENLYNIAALPEEITLFHAAALFGLAFFFIFWLLSVNPAFFVTERPLGPVGAARPPAAALPSSGTGPILAPADRAAFDRLNALMDEKIYREEGLTVARLAEAVGVPEHHLRRLINRELGFRNFTAFLNARRIEDAKAALADPANARKQVLQIALDLGYGSVAPFNRAFKDATGLTPTQFRKNGPSSG